jgi:hypothetical protein
MTMELAHMQTHHMIVLEIVSTTMMEMVFVMNSKSLDAQTVQLATSLLERQMMMVHAHTIAWDALIQRLVTLTLQLLKTTALVNSLHAQL